MTKEQAIKTAAKWWENKLRKREHHDNGDYSRPNQFAMLMADMLMQPVTEEQLKVFREELEQRIAEKLEDRHSAWLTTDYTPCRSLYEASVAAGISEHNFPYKVGMYIDPSADGFVIKVHDGYGAPRQMLEPWEEDGHAEI